MIEYDLLLNSLRNILKENVYCEDNELKIKCKAKYDLYNLLNEIDKGFINKLHKELEYNE